VLLQRLSDSVTHYIHIHKMLIKLTIIMSSRVYSRHTHIHVHGLKAEKRSESQSHHDVDSHLSESADDGPVHLNPPAKRPYGTSGVPPASDGVVLPTAAEVDADDACAIAAAAIMAL